MPSPPQIILIDIGHPAHVHFFRNPIRIWQERGCSIFVTSRKKEIATDLLDTLHIPHQVISSQGGGGAVTLGKEMILRNRNLLRVISRVRPDIMVGIGGIFIAHTGMLKRIPSIVFYDTENATLSNLITYPFCSLVAVPECYRAWLPPWHLRYPGYHELSYLHPDVFTPDRRIAMDCGLDPHRKNFLIRTVSWQASHDLQEKGWNLELLAQTVRHLSRAGKVMISAEGELPAELRPFAYSGPPEKIHHLLAHLNLFVGESATMASECAVLGVPAIYAANTGRGYTDEQEARYRLVTNVRELGWQHIQQAMDKILATPPEQWQERRIRLLEDKISVSSFVAELVLNYPSSVDQYRKTFSSGKKN